MLQSSRSQPCPTVLVGDLERICSRMSIRVLAILLREPGSECMPRTVALRTLLGLWPGK